MDKKLKDVIAQFEEKERELADSNEELEAQKEELTAAVEELIKKNKFLNQTLAELNEKNNELDLILYRSSHDLRSPITSIQGIINLLKYEPISTVVEQYVSHIESKSTQMIELLDSLTSLAKATSNGIEPEEVDVHGLVLQCINELSHLQNMNQVKMEIKMDQHVKQFPTDVFLLRVIMKSLISNAVIFQNPYRQGVVKISASIELNLLRIMVEDNGDGIDPSIQDNIFGMFYRGSVKSTGSGLGLYIAKKATERLQASIHVDSKEGKTTFEIVIPALNG